MRNILVAAIALFSINSFACPDLTGDYLCDGESMSIATYEQNGVTFYEVNGDVMPADSKWYNLPDSASEKNAKLLLSCGQSTKRGDFAKLDYVSDYYDNGNFVANIVMEMFMYTDGNNLKQDVVGVAKGSFGEQPINESYNCTRQ